MVDQVKKSAALITAKQLPKVVEAAIKAAGHGTTTGPVVVKWDLMGIIYQPPKTGTPGDPQAFAAGVAAHINSTGHDVVPAVLTIDKRIIAGFFERLSIPTIREF